MNYLALASLLLSQSGILGELLETMIATSTFCVLAWNVVACAKLLNLPANGGSFLERLRRMATNTLMMMAIAAGISFTSMFVQMVRPEAGDPLQVLLFTLNVGTILAMFALPATYATYLWARGFPPILALRVTALSHQAAERRAFNRAWIYGGVMASSYMALCTFCSFLMSWPISISLDIPLAILAVAAVLSIMYWGEFPDRTTLGLGVTCIVGVSIALVPIAYLPGAYTNGMAQLADQFGVDAVPGTLPPPFSLARAMWGSLAGDVNYRYDQIYLKNGSNSLYFDAYLPPNVPFGAGGGSTLLPVVIMIHGGAWQVEVKGAYNLRQFDAVIARQGYAVFDIQYSLWSAAEPWKDIGRMMSDIGNFTSFLALNAGDYHSNLSVCAFLGRSAGGQLALLAALAHDAPYFTGNFTPGLGVKGVVGLYTIADLTLPPILVDTRPLTRDHARELSPITYVGPGQPAVLLMVGDRDAYLHTTALPQFLATMRAAGQRSVLVTLPFTDHGFDLFALDGPHGQITKALVTRFLALAFNA